MIDIIMTEQSGSSAIERRDGSRCLTDIPPESTRKSTKYQSWGKKLVKLTFHVTNTYLLKDVANGGEQLSEVGLSNDRAYEDQRKETHDLRKRLTSYQAGLSICPP